MSAGAVSDEGICKAQTDSQTHEHEEFQYLGNNLNELVFCFCAVTCLLAVPANPYREAGVPRWVIYTVNWLRGIKTLSIV